MSKKIKILIISLLIVVVSTAMILFWLDKKSRAIAYECYYGAGENYAHCGMSLTGKGDAGCYGSNNDLVGNRPEEGIKIQTKGIITNLCKGFDTSNMRHLYYDSKGRFIK